MQGHSNNWNGRGSRLLKPSEVTERTSLSWPTILKMRKAGAFPTAIDLGGARIAFLESEVEAWIAERATNGRVTVCEKAIRLGAGRKRRDDLRAETAAMVQDYQAKALGVGQSNT